MNRFCSVGAYKIRDYVTAPCTNTSNSIDIPSTSASFLHLLVTFIRLPATSYGPVRVLTDWEQRGVAY